MPTQLSVLAVDEPPAVDLALDHGTELTVRDVPRLVANGPQAKGRKSDRNGAHRLRYRSKRHDSLPHVVKFSGGRSSAMLLFILLENELLRQDRGDVIVFNNTSAEHPATYRFVGDCMRAARRYGIPFYQVEFQTYEDARRGEWTQAVLPTHKHLVLHTCGHLVHRRASPARRMRLRTLPDEIVQVDQRPSDPVRPADHHQRASVGNRPHDRRTKCLCVG